MLSIHPKLPAIHGEFLQTWRRVFDAYDAQLWQQRPHSNPFRAGFFEL
jgi:hypothetical protein